MRINLNSEIKQADLAALVGISQPRVAQLMAEGKIPANGSLGAVMRAYCDRLREQAAVQIDAACPDLPADARAVVDRVLAGAALEWLRSTRELVTRADADLSDEPDFEEVEDDQ